MVEYGYAGEILKIDLPEGKVTRLPTADYADRFVGGKGLAARLYWDMAPPDARAFSPENCFICTSGPLAGFTGFASSRWLACGKAAAEEREAFSHGNLGGGWGNNLKYAGYDGIVVQGKADKPVYVYIHDGAVEIKDAAHIRGKTTFEASNTLKAELGKGVSVLTIGQAAENLAAFATVFADEGASGSGGVGSILGSKNVKAIVVAGDRRPKAADPEKLRELADQVYKLTRGPKPDFWWIIPGLTKNHICSGCGIGCVRQTYKDEQGNRFKCFCQAIDTYRRPAQKYFNGWNEVILLAMRLCDGYGLDTSVMQAMIEWIIRCYKEGELSEENTGLPLAKIGSPEFIEALTRKIALREGFGDMQAQGTIKAAESISSRARELISYAIMNSSNEVKDYDPRVTLHNALCIATEPRRPLEQIHDGSGALLGWLGWADGIMGGMSLSGEDLKKYAEKYWGSTAAADYTSYEGKALASKRIQDRTYIVESLVLCSGPWPMSRVDGPALMSQILSAVTGKEIAEEWLEMTGERIFNMTRAVMLRQGWGGREGDRLLDYHHEEPIQYLRFDRECKVPGKDGEVASRKGTVIDREEFEKMKSEYYELRGWDVESGLPTTGKLEDIQLKDVAADLAGRGLLR